LEQHDFSISPLARCNSGETERSLASDCESGESEEMELLNSQELQKKFEKESSMPEDQPINRSVSAGFFSLLHQQAAFQKQIKALKEAFDPFLVDLSSNEDTNSERGSVCPELVQEHHDSEKMVKLRVTDSPEQERVCLQLVQDNSDQESAVSVRLEIDYAEESSIISGDDPDYRCPTLKRKGDAWVRIDGEEFVALTQENLARHDSQKSFQVFGTTMLLKILTILAKKLKVAHLVDSREIIRVIEEFLGVEMHYSKCTSVARSRAPTETSAQPLVIKSSRNVTWGRKNWTAEEFKTDEMKQLQVSTAVLEAWDKTNDMQKSSAKMIAVLLQNQTITIPKLF
jgi:hypothetical protein